MRSEAEDYLTRLEALHVSHFGHGSKFIAGNIKFAECQLSEGISLHLCNLIILVEIIILGELDID